MGFMECTPGITEPKMTDEPLGTEAEMTPGPDDYNPYEDPSKQAPSDDDGPNFPAFDGADAGTGGVELPSFDPFDGR